ncbi:hypothetical protein PCK1_000886 [Pneumocystis canis]|nr:hypothetical protein PCK1_000886 [Pneumocystis canis]
MVANCRNIVNYLLGFGLTPSNSRNSNVCIPNIVKASVLGIVVSVRNVVLFLTSFLDLLKISRYLGIPHIIGYSISTSSWCRIMLLRMGLIIDPCGVPTIIMFPSYRSNSKLPHQRLFLISLFRLGSLVSSDRLSRS